MLVLSSEVEAMLNVLSESVSLVLTGADEFVEALLNRGRESVTNS